jgi:hypothetical protein
VKLAWKWVGTQQWHMSISLCLLNCCQCKLHVYMYIRVYACAWITDNKKRVHMHVRMKLQANHRSLAVVRALNQISIILSYV